MARYTLTVFGGLALHDQLNDELVGGPRRKPLALLALLATAGESGAERAWLANMLWEESSERGAHSLSQALHSLNRELGGEVAVARSSRLSLNAGLVESDWAAFHAAASREQWEKAVAAYRGAFLDGVHFRGCEEFDRWAETTREGEAELHRAALRQLIRAARGERTSDAQARWLSVACASHPYDPEFAIELAAFHVRADNPDRAVSALRAHVRAVEQELESSPSPAVLEVLARLERSRASAAGADRSTLPAAEAVDVDTGRGSEAPWRAAEGAARSSTTARRMRPWHWPAMALAATALVAAVGLGVKHFRAPYRPQSFGDEIFSDWAALAHQRDNSTRGRVFVETPIVVGKDPALDTLAQELANRLTTGVRASHVAHAVARDTVLLIEQQAARQMGFNGPAQRWSKANAFIGVATTVTRLGDSIYASVAVERRYQRTGSEREAIARRMGRPAPWINAASNDRREVTETWPLLSLMVPSAHPGAVILPVQMAVTDALDEMRSCALEDHAKPRSLPWCWGEENKPEYIVGFAKMRQALRARRTPPLAR